MLFRRKKFFFWLFNNTQNKIKTTRQYWGYWKLFNHWAFNEGNKSKVLIRWNSILRSEIPLKIAITIWAWWVGGWVFACYFWQLKVFVKLPTVLHSKSLFINYSSLVILRVVRGVGGKRMRRRWRQITDKH